MGIKSNEHFYREKYTFSKYSIRGNIELCHPKTCPDVILTFSHSFTAPISTTSQYELGEMTRIAFYQDVPKIEFNLYALQSTADVSGK